MSGGGRNRKNMVQQCLKRLERIVRASVYGSSTKAVATNACSAVVEAVRANRAFVLQLEDDGRDVTVLGAAPRNDKLEERDRALIQEYAGKLKDQLVARHEVGGRVLDLAQLPADETDSAPRLLFVEHASDMETGEFDSLLCGCAALLLSAALRFSRRAQQIPLVTAPNADTLKVDGFVGDSDPARQILDFVGKVGPSDATVLLGGESGSGKEMVARAVHQASQRRDQAFIAVNCAALTEALLESELFGHEKGAFTGATERKLGRFELADKGTLFLDEIGELSLNCQAKFLRVLEEQVFERVGGTKPIRVDVRVVAATNRDLTEMVRRGAFREDLFYRLSVLHSVVPPLRARPGDIPLLADHFLVMLRSQVRRRVTGFTQAALDALIAHPWPGNVRELRNTIEYAIVLGKEELIGVDDLSPGISCPQDNGVDPVVVRAHRAADWVSARQAERIAQSHERIAEKLDEFLSIIGHAHEQSPAEEHKLPTAEQVTTSEDHRQIVALLQGIRTTPEDTYFNVSQANGYTKLSFKKEPGDDDAGGTDGRRARVANALAQIRDRPNYSKGLWQKIGAESDPKRLKKLLRSALGGGAQIRNWRDQVVDFLVRDAVAQDGWANEQAILKDYRKAR